MIPRASADRVDEWNGLAAAPRRADRFTHLGVALAPPRVGEILDW
jgi:hypothetical protein